MILTSMGALFMGLSSPLAHAGVAVSNFNMGPRALSPLAPGIPLRIMPLGASITWGQGSSDGNGYRQDLRDQLTNAGNVVNMVGSKHNGTMRDNDVEGWPGFRIDQVFDKAKISVPQFKPNVILVNVGTNDALQAHSVSTAGDRIQQMLEDLYTMSPRATVILSTLLINRNPATERSVLAINQQYQDLEPKLAQAGRRIVLVDMHAADGPLPTDMFDDTHPNDIGYKKMANIWYAGLVKAADLGFLQAPEAVAGIPDDGAQ